MPENIVKRFLDDCVVVFRAYCSIPDTLSIGKRLFVVGFFVMIVTAIPSWILSSKIVCVPWNCVEPFLTHNLISDILGYIALVAGIISLVGFLISLGDTK